MYLCWTLLIVLSTLVAHSVAAVATLPISSPNMQTQLQEHVQNVSSPDDMKTYLTDFPTGIALFIRQ